MFRQDFTCPALLQRWLSCGYGAVTHIARLSNRFALFRHTAWSAFARHY